MFDVVVLIGHFLIFCFFFVAAVARFGIRDGRVVVVGVYGWVEATVVEKKSIIKVPIWWK